MSGAVRFFSTPYGGILVEAQLFGLPNIKTQHSSDFYAMHIHENGDCSVPFDHTGEHYSKDDSPHPQHSGDMLPLMGNQGYALVGLQACTTTLEISLAIPQKIGHSTTLDLVQPTMHWISQKRPIVCCANWTI